MSEPSADFLPTVIGILQRLQDTSAEQGQTMLAFLLDLAKTEAEDEMRHAGLEAQRRTTLRESSTVGAWHQKPQCLQNDDLPSTPIPLQRRRARNPSSNTKGSAAAKMAASGTKAIPNLSAAPV